MTTTITGLVTNPDGSLLDGSIILTPLAWRADVLPNRLVSTKRVTAHIASGVVDVDIDTDGEMAWTMLVSGHLGMTVLKATVIPPASGEVRIDQLAPTDNPDVAVQPNPGPQGEVGPPGQVTVEGGVTANQLAELRAEFNSQLMVMQSQMRMDWLVDFQNGLLDGLRTDDTGWVNLTQFAANSPTTITDQWQIALARRVGDVVDVILGFTLGSGRSGALGALPEGFHPDAANSAITAMFSPGNTARGDVEIDPQGVVEVFGAGATVGNPYRAVFHFHTNDEFPLTMNRQIGGTL